ncbi:MAG: PaaI family thioesterase [Cypionkella sp.]
MMRRVPEPVHVVKSRRDAALAWLVTGVPYISFLGIQFDRRGDEVTALLPFQPMLIGNPVLPALHGGVTAGFLEVTALISLAFAGLWQDVEAGRVTDFSGQPALPKTINFGVDYLRAGLPRDAYARARVNRVGRRYASVQVEAWQDNVARPFALGSGRFVMAGSAE